MSMDRREFLQALAAAAAAGMAIVPRCAGGRTGAARVYELPRFGNVQPPALHRLPRAAAADPLSRAERQPRHRPTRGQPPHLVGEQLLKHFGVAPGHAEAHAFTHLDFDAAAAHATARSAASRTWPRW